MSLLRNYYRGILEQVWWEDADGVSRPVNQLERYHVKNIFAMLHNKGGDRLYKLMNTSESDFIEELGYTPAIDLMLLLGLILTEVGGQDKLYELLDKDNNTVSNFSNDSDSIVAFIGGNNGTATTE